MPRHALALATVDPPAPSPSGQHGAVQLVRHAQPIASCALLAEGRRKWVLPLNFSPHVEALPHKLSLHVPQNPWMLTVWVFSQLADGVKGY